MSVSMFGCSHSGTLDVTDLRSRAEGERPGDPRLPAARAGVWDVVAHEMVADGPLAVELGIEDTTLAVWLGAVRLDGPVGSWSGTQTVLYDEIKRNGIGQETYVGEGAYDGLTAALECIDAICDSYILEGTFGPMPDPVEPLAE